MSVFVLGFYLLFFIVFEVSNQSTKYSVSQWAGCESNL